MFQRYSVHLVDIITNYKLFFRLFLYGVTRRNEYKTLNEYEILKWYTQNKHRKSLKWKKIQENLFPFVFTPSMRRNIRYCRSSEDSKQKKKEYQTTYCIKKHKTTDN